MDVTSTIALVPSVGTPTGKNSAPPAEVSVDTHSAARPYTPAPVQVPMTRMELDVDKASDRFVGRVVDTETGTVVVQIPSEAMLRLWEKTREMIGALLDKRA